jgi:CO dehydrogenase/acetyl-CoA synthase epsilon subunit
LTRSGGMRTGLGFLANKVYRCVVPITRAREYLFIVGDEDLFKRDNNWREVLSKIQNRVHLEKDYV